MKNSRMATGELNEEIRRLKNQPGKNMMLGSPSLIRSLTQSGLIDEYRFCLQPIVLGSGLSLFKGLQERTDLRLIDTKIFDSGTILLTYGPK